MTVPSADEWAFAGFPADRLQYLERDEAFEAIAHWIATEASAIYIRPPERGEGRETADGIRCRFRVAIPCDLMDRFFNGRDGYRGRYWQSEARGQAANRHLLDRLIPALEECARARPGRLCGVSIERALASLRAPSAKLWVGRQDANGRDGRYADRPHLLVRRWQETLASGDPLAKKALHGPWAPYCPDLDVKGGFVTEDGRDLEPLNKRDRSRQIRLAGFT